MRHLIWVSLVVVTFWCLWWAGASAFLRGGIESWINARSQEGWQTSVTRIEGGGFPGTLVAHLIDPAFDDPDTGVAVSMPTLTLEAKAWWPGYAKVILPNDTISLNTPDGRFETAMSEGSVAMNLHPGTKLQVQDLAWNAGPWGVTSDPGTLASADTLNIAMVQRDAAETYDFVVSAQALRPGEVLRSRFAIPDRWPIAFDTLEMNMAIKFDRPWDLRSLEERRPQPRRIDLHLAEAAWGTVNLNVAAQLDVDDVGTASGDVTLQAQNWRDVLTIAKASNLLSENAAEQMERVLGQFAELSGNPNTIDVKLTLRNGLMFLGFIPLGTAPQIILH